jgi:hypothetical protein
VARVGQGDRPRGWCEGDPLPSAVRATTDDRQPGEVGGLADRSDRTASLRPPPSPGSPRSCPSPAPPIAARVRERRSPPPALRPPPPGLPCSLVCPMPAARA